MDTISKFLTPGIVFLLTLIFGFWLSLAGKPYNGLLFNLHKLIALGAVILAGMQVYKLTKGLSPQGWLAALIIVAVVCAVALFFSGAMLSAGKLAPAWMLGIHRIGIVVEFVSMAAIVYLLSAKAS
jgi:hypothetical protein